MRIIALGDIHGKEDWKKVVDKNPFADLFVFLGDYVSTHDNISSEDQINNLDQILKFKEENPDKVILLRGNHDIQHLGYYWAQCSGYFPKVAKWMIENKDRFLKLTQWVYINDDIKTIFSHAGISNTWLNNNNLELSKINELEPSELFGFTPEHYGDIYGDSVTQPLTWIRPFTLLEDMLESWNQIVGHTTQIAPTVIENNNVSLTLCDTKLQYFVSIGYHDVIVKIFEKIT